MNVRRSAAVLAAAVVIGAAAPAVAADSSPSASPSQAFPAELYGGTDPTYDGVWRQSLALLAQDTVGVRPAKGAVDWLVGQQCADGAFAPYRAEPASDCGPKNLVDTNSTAAAVQALAALGGHDAATGKAVTWLKSVQNKDGGWGYTAGGASDTNSTSVVIGALAAVGEKPDGVVKGGQSPYDALLKLALPCEGDGAGAFAFQPDKKGALVANADATAAGVVGVLGKGLVVTPGKAASAPTCADARTPEQAAANGAAHLTQALAKDGHLMSALPGAEDQPDYGNTADAVVALAARSGADAAQKPLRWLEQNSAKWAQQSGPAACAQLILAAHAAGADPRDFGGADLVKQLNATGPAPQQAATDKQEEKKDDDSPFGVWWYVGIFLVVGIGIGFLLSGRKKGPQA
ncbi:prenyltransferase/squalene oxidase repeat-containing protein [Streptomyces lanatus]|uniref:Prenyltransferase/squalene oxidase repeat-containing protein n=1 Tax=Streptomyces lanatus TaxID=66900 RepID=A0ABV1XJK2_9ACTN|nr:prenyltransferase/squalene oxidase repeat-containing protein [Streptomyces lanatus]